MSMDIMRTNTALLLSMVLMKGYAAVDPVAWSLSPKTGFPQVNPGETTSVVYTLTVNPRFPRPVVLHTQFNKIGGTFAITDTCNNVTVKPGGNCQVTIRFTATDATPSSIQMNYEYNNNVIRLSRLNTSVTDNQSNVMGTISNLPAEFTLSNPEQQPVFTVTYTNKGSASVTGYAGTPAGTNLLSAAPESVATVSVVAGGNSCGKSNNPITLAPGASCSISGRLTPHAVGNLIVAGLFTFNNGNNTVNPTGKTKVVENQPDVVGDITNLPAQFTLSNPEQQPIFKVTYTNNGSTSITGYAGNMAGTNLLSATPESVATVSVVPDGNNCGTVNGPITLAPGKNCSISGQLTPHAVGNLKVAGLFTYNNGANTVNPTENTQVVNGSGQCKLLGSVNIPFHNPTYQYSDNVLQFKFTNSCTTAVTLGAVTFPPTGPSATVTPADQYDGCSNVTLAANDSCTVLVSVIPQTTGSLTVSATVTADSNQVVVPATTTVQSPGYTHKVTFINQCPFAVWYGVSQPSGSVDPTPNPSPLAYFLSPQVDGNLSATKSITIQGSYNGQFFPRTGCSLKGSSFICATGDCASGSNAQCPSGTVYEPYTRIEETFTANTQGGYDIALINGASIPAELKGLGPQTSLSSSPAAPYVCSGAGAPIQAQYSPFTPQYPPPPPPQGPKNPPATPLGNCPWQYTAPMSSPLFNFVTNGTTVTDCSTCPALSSVCGLAFETTPAAGNIVLACGNLIGYWTINQLCSGNVTYKGANPAMNPSAVFNCNSPISNYSSQSYPAGTTAYSLYACVPNGASLDSCYNNTNTTCCGARDWNDGTYLTWQTQQSYFQNPDWVNGGSGSGKLTLSPTPLESIQWLKEACPTAYSYPFDDHAGTFNCDSSDPQQQNHVNMDFEIVFCPGGVIGDLSQNP